MFPRPRFELVGDLPESGGSGQDRCAGGGLAEILAGKDVSVADQSLESRAFRPRHHAIDFVGVERDGRPIRRDPHPRVEGKGRHAESPHPSEAEPLEPLETRPERGVVPPIFSDVVVEGADRKVQVIRLGLEDAKFERDADGLPRAAGGDDERRRVEARTRVFRRRKTQPKPSQIHAEERPRRLLRRPSAPSPNTDFPRRNPGGRGA